MRTPSAKKATGLEVFVNISGDPKRDKSALEIALREFKKKVKKSEIMNELKIRESYMKPSVYKKYRHNESIKQKKRDERKALRSKKETDIYF